MAWELRSFAFRRERESYWRELMSLLDKVERHGLKRLTAPELERLPILYRQVVGSLSLARAISLDRNLLDFLESLAARAYLAVYGTRTPALVVVRTFFFERFPRAFRTTWLQFSLALGLLALGVAVGWVLTLRNLDHYYALVPASVAQDRGPLSTTESLRSVLYQKVNVETASLTAFSSFLFTHNAKVGILAFALGFAFGVPVILLMFSNGLILGAMAALYQTRGLGWDFWGWVLPHGVTELMAIAICGGAGFTLARAVIFPGRDTRAQALARKGRVAGALAFGTVACFFIAGLIEGYFRQLVHNPLVRYSFATLTLVLWLAYFSSAGRKKTVP